MRASARGLLFAVVAASMLFGGCADRHGVAEPLAGGAVPPVSSSPVSGSPVSGDTASAADGVSGIDYDADYGDPEPPTGLGAYLAGRHAEQEFDLPEALALQQRALADDPDNATLKQRVLALSIYTGRIAEAKDLANELAEGGNTPLATAMLGVEAAREQNWNEAQKQFEGLPTRGAFGLLRGSALAWAQLALSGPGAAHAILPPTEGAPIAQMDAALIEDVAGRTEQARAAWDAVLNAAVPSLRTAQLAGNFFERSGDAERAASLYDSLRSVSSRSTILLPKLPRPAPKPIVADARAGLSETLLTLAAALNEQRGVSGPGSGLGFARMALRLAPGNSMAALLTAEILENHDRREEVTGLLSAVPPDDMLYEAAQIRLATNLDLAEKTDEAAAGLRKLGERWRDDPEPYLVLGDIYRARERFAEAVGAYDEAFRRIGPLQPQHWRQLYYRGISLERSGQWERAEADFKQALAFDGEQASVLNYLGYSWVDRGMNIPEAEEMIRKAVTLRPEDGFIIDSLGWVYYRTGRYPEAVQELEKAVALEPADPTINEHLGDAYWKVGRQNEARFQWQRALRLEPEKDRVAGIEAKLSCGLNGCGGKAAAEKAKGG